MTKYIISLEAGEPYPFDGPKEQCSLVTVRKFYLFTSNQQEKTLHQHLRIFLSLNCLFLVQTVRVLECKGKCFVVDYEYVGQNLKSSPKMQESGWSQQAKDTLLSITDKLTQNGIKIDLKVEDIGVSSEGEIKLFVPLVFQVVEEKKRKILSQEYYGQIEKLFQQFNFRCSIKAPSEISDYSYRLEQKISEIEGRLDKMKNKKRKRSRSGKSDGSNSDQTKNKPTDCLSKWSNCSITSQKTSNSTIEPQLEKQRPHKSSFSGFPTTSSALNEPGAREDSLKKRLQAALEKTQKAFKIYDKGYRRNVRF